MHLLLCCHRDRRVSALMHLWLVKTQDASVFLKTEHVLQSTCSVWTCFHCNYTAARVNTPEDRSMTHLISVRGYLWWESLYTPVTSLCFVIYHLRSVWQFAYITLGIVHMVKHPWRDLSQAPLHHHVFTLHDHSCSNEQEEVSNLPMAWAKAMTTSWQVVNSVTPHTTRCTPSTHTFSSMAFIQKPSFLHTTRGRYPFHSFILKIKNKIKITFSLDLYRALCLSRCVITRDEIGSQKLKLLRRSAP